MGLLSLKEARREHRAVTTNCATALRSRGQIRTADLEVMGLPSYRCSTLLPAPLLTQKETGRSTTKKRASPLARTALKYGLALGPVRGTAS